MDAQHEHDPWQIAAGWWGTDGAWHEIDPEVRAALADAAGAREHPGGPPGSHTWFVTHGDAPALQTPGTVILESGELLEDLDGLPPELPLGTHTLLPLDGGPNTDLFVVPRRAPRPARCWGISAQLYGLRSARSPRHGSLAELAELAELAQRHGAALVAHNPLGAPLPIPHQQPSPYYASTRRFWSPLYLSPSGLLERAVAGGVAPTDALIDSVRSLEAASDARSGEREIDRDVHWRRLLDVLEQLWAARRIGNGPVPPSDEEADTELDAYATFCAISELQGTGWQAWPSALRHPDAPAVARFAEQHRDRVAFWRWLQLELDAQLAEAARAGAGLVADLPVGFDPDGFDAWTDQDLLALGCRIGAPPDEFNTLGQDWGLPPYVPWRLRAAGYRPWLQTLRRVLAHAAALRIDHVMGLFRLYWIPEGHGPRSGGYVGQHGTELLDLAVMEATRAGATLIGEDLGTVEAEVRSAMGERDVFGYRIGWFSDDDPRSWPSNTLGALSTHDLPTVVGLLDGTDAADRAHAGLPEDPAGDQQLRARLERLVRLGAELTTGNDPGPLGADVVQDRAEVVDLAHAALAAAGSDVVVVTLEDVVGEARRPNLPGTVDEHPNWRRPLPVTLEQLERNGLERVAGTMSQRADGSHDGERSGSPR